MISDGHTDFITELNSFENKENYVKNLKQQGVKTICSAVFTTQKKLNLKQVEEYKKQIEELKAKYRVNLLFSVEDLGFLKDEEIQKFIELNPISTTLTWNFKNQFAGGAKTNSGITKCGRRVVKKLQENNILIDTAHLSRRAFWDFVKITTKPIYNSHSNIYALRKHNRNLTNKQIQKIVETNGYLGLTIYDEFVAEKKITSLDIAKQFDYLIKKFGYLNFGFGTDFYGIDKTHLPIDINNYLDLEINVSNHLFDMGYSTEVVECIMYKNFDNFLKRTRKKLSWTQFL